MAQVPIEPAATVPLQNAPPAYTSQSSIPAFGDKQAAGLSRAADGLMEFAKLAVDASVKAAREDERVSLSNADTNLTNSANSVMFGQDGQSGFASLHGQQIIDAAPDVVQQLRDARQSTLDNLGAHVTPEARAAWEAHSAHAISDRLASVARSVEGAKLSVADDASTARIAASVNSSALNWNDPQSLNQTMNAIDSEVAAIGARRGWDPATIEGARIANQSSAVHAAISAAIIGDPTGATAQTILDRTGPNLSANVRIAAEKAIAEAKATSQAQVNAVVQLKAQDNLASLGLSGTLAHPEIGASAIVQAYGPVKGPLVVQELKDTEALFHAKAAIALTPLADDVANLQTMRTDASATPPVPGLVAERASIADDFAKAVTAKAQALARDPAGYVASVTPGIAALQSAAGKDVSMLPAYAAQLDAAYDKVGQPSYARPLLPKASAEGLVSSIVSQPPEAQAQAITSLLDPITDPTVRNRVAADLARAGLPPQLKTLISLPNPADRSLLAGTIGKTKELRAALPKSDAGTIDDRLLNSDDLQDMRASMRFAPGGPAAFGDLVETLKPLGYSFALQGKSPTAAADAAVAALMQRYAFWHNGGEVARVPAGTLDAAMAASSKLLDGLKASDLLPPANSSGIALTGDQSLGEALKQAQRGFWATNETGTSLVRYGLDGHVVMLAQGGRLEIPFSSLMVRAPAPVPAGLPPQGGNMLDTLKALQGGTFPGAQ